MIIIDKKILMYTIREVHFSDNPFDIENCDFINFCYCKNKLYAKDFTRQEELTSVIDLDQDLDSIWHKMDNKNVRYYINRGYREGIKIHINKKYNEFYKMTQYFNKKKGIKSHFDFLGVGRTSLEVMQKYGTLFIAEYDGVLLAGTLFLEDGSTIRSWIGSSIRFDSDKKKRILAGCGNRLIDWEVIKYAKDKGIKEFDLGGLWSEEEAKKDILKQRINDYKLRVGGDSVTRYSYTKIYSKTYSLFYHLYDLKSYIQKAAL